MICKKHPANGFTLAEIIISTLLLSIFAVGSFKSFHYAQHAANTALMKFLKLNQEKQKIIISKLGESYSTIHVDKQFPLLKCLTEQKAYQQADCTQIQQ